MNDFNGCVIQTTGLTKTYKGIRALKALDLKVARNSIFGFLGPNGAGKTTTIKLLLGLIQPSAGTAESSGMDIQSENVAIRRRSATWPRTRATTST